MEVLAGEPLPAANRLTITPSFDTPAQPQAAWVLRGITSNERYVVREEKDQIVARLLGLGRPETTCGVLIAIRKNEAWWALTQDERLSIFYEQSHHTRTGLRYFPELARRLHHCRDLSENEPFDFITWFEHEPAQATAFNKLVAELRATEEWKYVEREVEIRLVREDTYSPGEAALRSHVL
jgi:hypothetical protein